ncbi:hypothetical protein D3C78_1739000 [compost metagenome]
MISLMSTTMITPTTIIMIMPTLMTTAIPTRIPMTMTMTMTTSRVICTTAKGKRDCRCPAWGSAS